MPRRDRHLEQVCQQLHAVLRARIRVSAIVVRLRDGLGRTRTIVAGHEWRPGGDQRPSLAPMNVVTVALRDLDEEFGAVTVYDIGSIGDRTDARLDIERIARIFGPALHTTAGARKATGVHVPS